MMKFVTAHQNHHFASACTEASSACVASASCQYRHYYGRHGYGVHFCCRHYQPAGHYSTAPADYDAVHIGRSWNEFALTVPDTVSGSAKRRGRFLYICSKLAKAKE